MSARPILIAPILKNPSYIFVTFFPIFCHNCNNPAFDLPLGLFFKIPKSFSIIKIAPCGINVAEKKMIHLFYRNHTVK